MLGIHLAFATFADQHGSGRVQLFQPLDRRLGTEDTSFLQEPPIFMMTAIKAAVQNELSVPIIMAARIARAPADMSPIPCCRSDANDRFPEDRHRHDHAARAMINSATFCRSGEPYRHWIHR